MLILQESGLLGSRPTGPGSGYSLMAHIFGKTAHTCHVSLNSLAFKSPFSRLEARKQKSFVVRDIVSVSPNFCSTYKGLCRGKFSLSYLSLFRNYGIMNNLNS